MKREPGPDKRITNTDEQDVAVNQSARQEGGFDEPSSTVTETPSPPQEQGSNRRRITDDKKSDPEKPAHERDSPEKKVD